MLKEPETEKLFRRLASSLRLTSKRELARMRALADGAMDASDASILFTAARPASINALGERRARPGSRPDRINTVPKLAAAQRATARQMRLFWERSLT